MAASAGACVKKNTASAFLKTEEAYVSTKGDDMWSDDNTSEREQVVHELSDEEIKAIVDKALLNFQLRKVDWRAEVHNVGLPPVPEKLNRYIKGSHISQTR